MPEVIGKVDHHGNATTLKQVGGGLIEVYADDEFVNHVQLSEIVALAREKPSPPEVDADAD